MKIFSASQISACDAYTIHASRISSLELMERAAGKCAAWIGDNYPPDTLFVIICGTGNNGGDGLAITRMLHQQGYGVKAFLVKFSDELSKDCKANLLRLQKTDSSLVSFIEPESFITDIPKNIIIIDALFGTGLNREPEGWIGNFIKHINNLPNKKIAIDMPSGLPADSIPKDFSSILKVNDTLSFQFYKRAFLHPETGIYAGQVHILDIELDQTFINATHSHYKTIDAAYIAEIYRPRDPFSHKGNYGHALVTGGSYGKMGAITLSAKAALRAGAGLVTALVPACGYGIMQTALPEVMCLTSGNKYIEDIYGWDKMNALGIGPGLDTEPMTANALNNLLDNCKQPIVIDADALNIIARQQDMMAKIPPGSILTPHPKEFTRLFGDSANSMQQLEQARTQAMRYNVQIVLKGHHTSVVTTEGECWYNLTGNAGMATGGTGDVLTGIVTGLLAQHYTPEEAAILGVYIHGFAGDIAAGINSEEALIAGDIIDNLGKAFTAISNSAFI